MLYLNGKTSNLEFFIILIVSIATNKFMAILQIKWPFKMYSNAAISKEVNNLFTTKKKK